MNITDKITDCQILKESERCRVLLASADGYREKIIIKELPADLLPLYQLLLKTPSIHFPAVYELEIQNGQLLTAEEYIEGKTLAALLAEHRFAPQEAVSLILQLCDGIEILHNAVPPVIHRDLTPWNLILSKDNILKIIDFDTARIYKPGAGRDTRRLGTAEYAPPEQFGYAQTDWRSDIYSIGVLLYELTYSKAFRKSSVISPITGQSYRKINRVINRCTMFSPDQRYQSVAQLRHALIRFFPLRKNKKDRELPRY